MRTLIVVPARYGSTRFSGKPLARIAGRSMLHRVALRAKAAAHALRDAECVVATDDQRIADHCQEINVQAVITDPALPSGSDRAYAASQALGASPDYIVNLQGDAPFTPIDYMTSLVDRLDASDCDVATPVIRLDWSALDDLRAAKKETPFSGTTAIIGKDDKAIWFSKTIIPSIRNEDALRSKGTLSPVRRHVGLYAFRNSALRQFCDAPKTDYEESEGLEQLRLLENGLTISCVEVATPPLSTSGIDTKTDLDRLEHLIAQHGDLDDEFFANA